MLFDDIMGGIGAYLGTTDIVVAAIIAIVTIIVTLGIMAYYKLEGLPLILAGSAMLGLFVIVEWLPYWVPLFLIFLAAVYLVFTGVSERR